MDPDRLRAGRGHRHRPDEAAVRAFFDDTLIKGLPERLPDRLRNGLDDPDTQGSGSDRRLHEKVVLILLGDFHAQRRPVDAGRNECRNLSVKLPFKGCLFRNGQAAHRLLGTDTLCRLGGCQRSTKDHCGSQENPESCPYTYFL